MHGADSTNAAAGSAAAAAQGVVQLHIGLSIAQDAPFFADLVMQYSSNTMHYSSLASTPGTITNNNVIIAQPSITIQPAGNYAAHGGSSPQEVTQEAGVRHHADVSASSSSSSRSGQASWESLNTLIGGVPALAQVSSHVLKLQQPTTDRFT